MFKNILCPVDFDEQSLSAIEIARQTLEPGGRIRFLHLGTFPFALTEQEAKAPLSLAQERMDALVRDRLDHQLLHEVIVESSDDVAKSILQAAVRFDSDCIVLATHARRGIDKFLVGSVAEKVIRDATCPVLTIARPDAPHAAHDPH